METKDPALTKNRISDTNSQSHDEIEDRSTTHHDSMNKGTETFQETIIGSKYATDSEIEENTTINKGTDTFEEGVVESKHVYDDDNPARQPDRRDQEGSTPFDKGVNEDTVGSEAPKSEGITDMNRYASIDNAQTRILNPDEKD